MDTRTPAPPQRSPLGVIPMLTEAMWGAQGPPELPPPTPAERRAAARVEARDLADTVQRWAVVVGLIVLEVLAAILLHGAIRFVY